MGQDGPSKPCVFGLEAVRWDRLTAEGREWLSGSRRGRLHVHKGAWQLRFPPEKMQILPALNLHAEIVASGVQLRGIVRRRITLICHGRSRLPLSKEWRRLRGGRLSAIKQMGELVRAFHDHGIDCRSWSAALSRCPREGCFCLRDPRSVHIAAKPLKKKPRLHSLARLLAEFWGLTSVAQRVRFLKSYGADRRDFALIGRYGMRLQRRNRGLLARASIGDNPDFFRLQRGPFRIHGRNSTAAWRALGYLLPDPDACWSSSRIYKDGTRTHAGSLVVGQHTYFLKRFNDRGWWYRLRHFCRESRAIRTWRTSWDCLSHGISVPEPLLCLEERRYGFLRRSYLLTCHVGHEARLRDIWPNLSATEKHNLLARLGSLLGKTHALGWVHGDLKWDNLLLPTAGETPILIDWDGSFRPGWARRRAEMNKDVQRFLRDLERFGGSSAEKRHFLFWWRQWTSFV